MQLQIELYSSFLKVSPRTSGLMSPNALLIGFILLLIALFLMSSTHFKNCLDVGLLISYLVNLVCMFCSFLLSWSGSTMIMYHLQLHQWVWTIAFYCRQVDNNFFSFERQGVVLQDEQKHQNHTHGRNICYVPI